MEVTLLCLSIALIFGLMMSRVAKKIGLPAVTAYLVGGLILGPFCIGRLGISGVGFNSLEQVESFKILTQVALGFIAFTIGNEFRLTDLKKMGKQAFVVGILEGVTTTVVVDIVLITLHFVAPQVLSLSSAITLGAIAAATAPAATLMVVRQYKAQGPLTKLLLMVVALDDAVGLILFAASFGIANALEQGTISVVSVLVEPLLEILLSFVLGAVCGMALTYTEKFFHSGSKRLAIAVAFVFFTVGLSMKHFTIGGVHCGFSLLLVCMMTGTVFCNMSDASLDVMGRIDGWNSPLNILFFVLSGSELDLSVLANPLVLLIGIFYMTFRCVGKYTGARVGSKITHSTPEIQKYLGITLFPQAGVALGMSVTAANLADGKIVRNVVLFGVLIYELVGPTLTKKSLLAAGEIQPEGRKSSREVNAEGREIDKHRANK